MLLKQHRLRTAALATLAAACYTSLPAVAADTAAKTEELQEVVITGSRIVRPNLESSVPVISVGSEEIFQTGNNSVGDLLDNLPAIRSTYSQSNSSRFLGTTGLSLLDLRGLGTQRTLVLVNGRRHVGADILNNAVSPDVNTFPSDLIERVDVVTGGSSSVYGSDAVAGVVNFVLKKNFEGLQFRAQGGQSAYHDGGDYFASLVGGQNFADGKGNVAVDVEYAVQRPVFAANRPNLASVSNFVVVDTDPASAQFGSDGVPDRTYYNDIRSATIAIGGLVQISPAAGFAPCGKDKDGATYRCQYIFQPDGSFAPQTGTRIGLAPSGNFVGGNGTTGRERETLGIFPALNRLSFNLVGHYTISDAFEPFVEAKFVRTDSLRYGTPAFFQGATIGGGDLREKPRLDNPYLSAATVTAINAARTASGLAAITTNFAASANRLTLLKNLTDLGGRQEDAKRETSRIVLGATGKFADDWSYEASLNYGQFKEATNVLGNVNKQRFLLAMDAAKDTAGNIVCRAKIDSTAAVIAPNTNSDAYATSLLAGDVAACTPLNPFGEGNISPAMRQYLIQDTTSIGQIKQFDAMGFVSGNSARWFSLPAGPLGISVGAEYRTEKNLYKEDPLVAQGMTFYNAIADYTPPTQSVKEFFGELLIPVLKDKPFAKDLSLSAAGRSSSYSGNVGRVTAYNAGLEWTPISDLRFRAGLARSVRAPNLSELYTAQGQNFATVVDPCSLRNIATGSATRAANCRAAGIPANYDFVYTASLGFLSGGNPALKAEDSDSVTIGAVFQPAYVPNLSLSVDYFSIKVNNAIASVSAQNILNLCYDSATLNNVFCSLFQRAGASGGTKGEVGFQILEGSLLQSSVNYAKRTARGVDVEAAYKHTLGTLGTLDTRLVYTHALERNNYEDVTNPSKANQILGELGDPKDAFNLDLNFKHDKLTWGAKLRYIGRMVLNNYEDTYSVQGRDPENADYADQRYYPSVWYTDLRLGYDVSPTTNVYLGIDNVADRIPPFGLSGATEGGGIYEAKGRFYYVGVKATLF
jgi:outer membrane receptor protein involved in Fe transport